MKFVRSVQRIEPLKSNGKTIVYMHGYGGYTWMAMRQLKAIRTAGCRIIALDFSYVLRSRRPQDLVDLMDEVDDFFQTERLISEEVIIVGISLGGLIGYNLLRRHPELKRLLVITGGNIALLPSSRSLQKKWKLTRNELIAKWRDVNMYTPAGMLKDRHMIMLLPLRDKVIDPREVEAEIALQQNFNRIRLIRTKGGHFRTIINETILRPRRVLDLIHELERK